MAEKAFASLSSGLLARKGAAKPAMRPQGFGSFGSNLEDLGWNDMGHAAVEEHVPSPVTALTPAPHPAPQAPAEPPAVHEQQRAIAESFAAEPEAPAAEAETKAPATEAETKAPVVKLPRRRRAAKRPENGAAKAKTAFTLRLDADRHFKLRLACALTAKSAQQLVTEALDEFLQTIPEVESLARRVPAEAGQRSR